MTGILCGHAALRGYQSIVKLKPLDPRRHGEEACASIDRWEPRRAVQTISAFENCNGSIGAKPDCYALTAPTVPAGRDRAAHLALSEVREEFDQLQAIVEAGGGEWLNSMPASSPPSPFPHLLADDGSAAFDDFKKPIGEDASVFQPRSAHILMSQSAIRSSTCIGSCLQRGSLVFP